MKCIVPLVLLFLSTATPARSTPLNGVIVDSTHYDTARNILISTVANVSHKDVTAFALDVHFADGDLLEVNEELLAGDFFHPGTTMDIPLTPQKTVTVIASAVIYADDTAEATNARVMKHMMQSREEAALALRRANELLAANPNDPEAVAKELEREGSIHTRRTTDPMPSEGILLDLARRLRQSKDLGAFAQTIEKEAQHYTDHAHPAVTEVKP